MKYFESKSAIALGAAAAIGIVGAFGFAYHVGNKVSDEIVETVEETVATENTDQTELEVDVIAPQEESETVEATDEVIEEAQ